MAFEEISCGRCKKTIIGFIDDGITEGFFDMTDPEWKAFANPGETFVCNECIEKDDRYIKYQQEGE
jgi:hypothetical protein